MSLKDTADETASEIDNIKDDLNVLIRRLDREVKEADSSETEDSKREFARASNCISDAVLALTGATNSLEDVEEPDEPEEEIENDSEEEEEE